MDVSDKIKKAAEKAGILLEGLDESGSPGTPGQGFGKGSAAINTCKYVARTVAQALRENRRFNKFK